MSKSMAEGQKLTGLSQHEFEKAVRGLERANLARVLNGRVFVFTNPDDAVLVDDIREAAGNDCAAAAAVLLESGRPFVDDDGNEYEFHRPKNQRERKAMLAGFRQERQQEAHGARQGHHGA